MPVKLTLSSDERYLMYSASDPLAMEDLLLAYEEDREHRDRLAYKVHVIVDLSKVKRVPSNWLMAKAAPGFSHPRSGEVLFVGISESLRIFLNVLLKITGFKRVKLFNTLDEALEYMETLITRPAQQA